MSSGRELIMHDHAWIAVSIFAFLGLMVDGVNLMFLSYSLSSLKQESGLLNVEAGAPGSVTLADVTIDGIYGGWTADRFRRMRTVVQTILVFSAGTAAFGFTYDFTQSAVFRLIASLGLGTGCVVCNTLMAKYVPTERRTTVPGALQAGWSVGYTVVTLLIDWILPTFGWRWSFFVAITSVVIAVLMQCFILEPASRLTACVRGDFTRRDDTSSDGAIRCTFGSPAPRRMFILWSLTTDPLQFGYYGVSNWMPTYLERELHFRFSSMTDYMVGAYLAMILGKVVAGWSADKFGRRVAFAFGALGVAASLPATVPHHTSENIVYSTTTFGFLYGVPYGVNVTYMTESLGAHIRDSAMGGIYNVGHIGATVVPAAIGHFVTSGPIGFSFLVMGGAYFLCGLVPALFIREKFYDPQKSQPLFLVGVQAGAVSYPASHAACQ